jgi:hypothetical protein
MESRAFPSHGKLNCSLCFSSCGETIEKLPWRFRNDPGHWGSSNPRVLVLGFSKGATQVRAYDNKKFEDVAFAKERSRLKSILVILGLLNAQDDFDSRFQPGEESFAFASLIRCSVSRFDPKAADFKTSGPIILKSFKESEPRRLMKNCSERFLKDLPDSLKLVVMLGVQDQYINECRKLLAPLHQDAIAEVNTVAYRTTRVLWVHVPHPSGVNIRHFNNWVSQPNNQPPMGTKRADAIDAIRRFGGLH